MAITEELELVDKVSPAADAMAAAIAGVDEALKGAQATANAFKLPAALQTELAKSTNGQTDALKGADKWNNNVRKSNAKLGWRGVANNAGAATKKTKGFMSVLKGLKGAGGGGLTGIAKGLKGAGAAATIAIAAFAAFSAASKRVFDGVVKATIASEDWQTELSRFGGADSLGELQRLSDELGIKTGDAVSQFVELRKAGLKAGEADAFIRMRADLATVGVTAGEADAAINGVVKALKKASTPTEMKAQKAAIEGVESALIASGTSAKDTAAAMREINEAVKAGNAEAAAAAIAKAYGVAGTGADAAKKKATTLKGAMKNAAGLFDRMWAKMAANENVQEAMAGLAEGINEMVAAIEESPAVWNLLSAAFNAASSAAGALVSAITFVINILNGIGEAVGDAMEWLESLQGSFNSAGKSAGDSFIEGLLGREAAAAAAGARVGAAAEGGIRSSLIMQSPSKVMQGLGTNAGDSFNDSMNEALPDALIDEGTAPANDVSAGAAGGGGTPTIGELNINIQGVSGDPGEIGAAVKRAVIDALQEAAA